MSIFDWFKPATVESEARRGREGALAFIASRPDDEALKQWWSDACTCESFSKGDPKSLAYDQAAKEVVRPHWKRIPTR